MSVPPIATPSEAQEAYEEAVERPAQVATTLSVGGVLGLAAGILLGHVAPLVAVGLAATLLVVSYGVVFLFGVVAVVRVVMSG